MPNQMAKQILKEKVKNETQNVGDLYLLRKLYEKENMYKNDFVSYIDIAEDLTKSVQTMNAISILNRMVNESLLETAYEQDEKIPGVSFRAYRIAEPIVRDMAKYVKDRNLR